MGRDEHWDELELFDGYFLALLVYLVSGRLAYVVTHLSELDTLYRGLALLSYPGINGVVGTLCAMGFVMLFAHKHGWHLWKVLDVGVVCLAIALVFGAIAHILNVGPSWPVSVWMFLWSLITFAIVSRVRKNFRFYEWYKGDSSVAQEGLATLMFGLLAGIYYVMIGWLRPSLWQLWVVPAEMLAGIAIVMLSIYLITVRSGHKVSLLQWWRKRG